MPETGRGRSGDGDTDEFARRLRELKANGSTVLVTGSGSKEVHTAMCRRLLGEESVEPRHRLLVFANGTFAIDERLPHGGADGGDTQVLTASATRSTTAAASRTTGLDVVDLGDASLSELGAGIVEAVEGFERRHGRLDATELRVGVDSLSPLLDVHGERAVFNFLLVASAYLREFEALGHVHLPVTRESYVVQLLAPLFDAVVEVRVRAGQPQQRWHIDGGDVTSRWLSL
jgi:hypothetical protein